MSRDTFLSCVFEDGELRIRIGADVLKFAAEHCDGFYNGSIESCGGPYIKVTDADEFAHEIVRLLNAEEEDGTTDISRVLDRAIQDAYNNGCDGVDHEFVQAGQNADTASTGKSD